METLYRRNNIGKPCFWSIGDNGTCIVIKHGILGKNTIVDYVDTVRNFKDEIKSRVNEKRKKGYKYLSELKDNNQLPVEEKDIISYLNTYLPFERTAADGTVLPMLAKVYDNANNKIFNKISLLYGQWKINGLRCFITAKVNNGDLFKPITLDFQSREGIHWKSLTNLEEYLLEVLPEEIIKLMIEEEYVLDGELYLPGHTVNEINHYVKDPKCEENKLLQYWCYDIAIQDCIQDSRLIIRKNLLINFYQDFRTKDEHLSNINRFVCLPNYDIFSDTLAIQYRNKFINLGFEGLILRNPNAEYQYGARNSAMFKFKKSTDGKFIILDIYPEGELRKNIPLFKLKNDINDECFEVHVGGNFAYQENCLKNKDKYIGKLMYVEYGERSGINQVPFHVKNTYIMS